MTSTHHQPRLRIVYRSHGGENMKSRPPYYSKLLALVSAVRAVVESGVEPQVMFWNDGPIPADRLEVMRAYGEVAQVEVGSNRASYRAAIDMAARAESDPTDVVWFAEDDYLYGPDTFRDVMAAAVAIPDADYLAVFGGLALDVASPLTAPAAYPHGGAVDVPDPVRVGHRTWFRAVSTTSTFGVRVAALREDRHLLRLIPYSGGAWDHTTCLAVQGRQPFSWHEIRDELLPFGEVPAAGWPSSIARGVVRSGLNLRSRRSEERRRRLYLCDPVAAVHMEEEDHDPDSPDPRDDPAWGQVAREVRAWALDRGIPLKALAGS